MLLAYGILRRYWDYLDPTAQQTIAALEEFEEAPDRQPDPPLDDFSSVMDLLIEYQKAAKGEPAMTLWLVGGWWPEVTRHWSEQELPQSWRPLFNDVFGDAFQPVVFDGRWRTSDVVRLATAIYDEKAFERMPILADALMDAGCSKEPIIAHCHGNRPHIRGCWAVDLILGKA
jgi:hypothetical protein